MMKNKVEIAKEFELLENEVRACDSARKAKEILKRYNAFCDENGITRSNNDFVKSGYAEMLEMMAGIEE